MTTTLSPRGRALLSPLGRVLGARPSKVGACVPSASQIHLGTDIAPEADLTAGLENLVRNQGRSSACVGEALSAGLYVAGKGRTKRASPEAIYTIARVRERARVTDPLADGGCQPADAVAAMAEWGVCAEADWPLDDAHLNEELGWGVLREISGTPVSGIVQVMPGPTLVDDVRRSLTSGWPVAFGMTMFASYDAYDGSGVWRPAPGEQPIEGGHMQCLVGYGVSGGEGYFLCLGSWGQSWGRGGFSLIAEEFIPSAHAWEFFSLPRGPVL